MHDDEDDDPARCECCGGRMEFLGVNGSAPAYRCRQCGHIHVYPAE